MAVKFGIAISILFAWLAIFEFLGEALLPRYGDPMQRARMILNSDSRLGWIARKSWKGIFEGKHVQTDADGFRTPLKAQGTQSGEKILVLGPSSAFGWGVEAEESWPQLIGNNVVNASQIGYSLVQGQKLYQSMGRTEDFSAVIIAYGVNDIDRFRFYGADPRSDAEFFSGSITVASPFEKHFENLALFEILMRATQDLQLYWNCGNPVVPQIRNAPTEFIAELSKWVGDLNKKGTRVVVVNSAYRWPVNIDKQKALESDNDYMESVRASHAGDCSQSRRLFRKARQKEIWRLLQDLQVLNSALRQFSSDAKIEVADIESRLRMGGSADFFVDPIHFSAKGHLIAAEVIKEALDRSKANARK